MSNIKSFADTSAVSLAYAMSGAAKASEVQATSLTYLPFTQEGFQLSKDSQASAAIRQNRRQVGSKNTRGSAPGSMTLEMGVTPFVSDMIEAVMMSNWVDHETDPDVSFIVDGEVNKFFLVEKRTRNVVDGTLTNFFERYYGNLTNQLDIEMGDGLATMSISTIAVFGDTSKASAASNADAGGLVSQYVAPDDYEIADSSNNVKRATIFDQNGTPVPATFSDLTLTIGNNVREQNALGSEFAAGMGKGKVRPSLSGTIYYYDDSILNAHLKNQYLSAEVVVETEDGELTFYIPRGKAEAPNANAQGEDQDYTQTLTINGEEGEVEFDGETYKCAVAIKKRLK